jgi:hypothetical protein
MGKMNLIKANWSGKVGETVGAKWKNVSTIRAYAKPTYTDTPAQQTIRAGFKAVSAYLSLMAPQLKPYSALNTRGMSVRNALLHLNKAEITAGALTPANLLLSHGGLPVVTPLTAVAASNAVTITWTPAVSPIIDAKAKIVAVWYNKAGTNCIVAAADNTTGTITINNATGAAADDDVWIYLLDYRGSAKVASPSEHAVTTA